MSRSKKSKSPTLTAKKQKELISTFIKNGCTEHRANLHLLCDKVLNEFINEDGNSLSTLKDFIGESKYGITLSVFKTYINYIKVHNTELYLKYKNRLQTYRKFHSKECIELVREFVNLDEPITLKDFCSQKNIPWGKVTRYIYSSLEKHDTHLYMQYRYKVSQNNLSTQLITTPEIDKMIEDEKELNKTISEQKTLLLKTDSLDISENIDILSDQHKKLQLEIVIKTFLENSLSIEQVALILFPDTSLILDDYVYGNPQINNLVRGRRIRKKYEKEFQLLKIFLSKHNKKRIIDLAYDLGYDRARTNTFIYRILPQFEHLYSKYKVKAKQVRKKRCSNKSTI